MKRLVVLALLTAACAAPRPPLGVVLITLDTTRWDRLSPYGFGDATMPALDRLAREGVVFDQAATVSPLTLPAHASLLTGLVPPRHGVRDNASSPLGEEHQTLAETLAAGGYRTAAFVGSSVLDPDRGLAQGFEIYDGPSLGRQRSAEAVMDAAIRWLATAGESPFLLWAHLYDPHRPYEAPEPFASRHDPYVAEIVYADSQIARLMAAVEQRRLLDRVIVIVVADHGESLGDHGERDHGVFLYESVLRIPLIVRAPGLPPRRVPYVVRIIDVMPTVLDLVGLPPPPLDGMSLTDAMRGVATNLDAYAESLYPARFGWAPLFALRSGRFKLIDAPQAELYDLDRDPFEERNIVDERPAVARRLQARLRALRADTHAGSQVGIDPELEARLSALGYVAGRNEANPAPGRNLPDPKLCQGVFDSGRCWQAGSRPR